MPGCPRFVSRLILPTTLVAAVVGLATLPAGAQLGAVVNRMAASLGPARDNIRMGTGGRYRAERAWEEGARRAILDHEGRPGFVGPPSPADRSIAGLVEAAP